MMDKILQPDIYSDYNLELFEVEKQILANNLSCFYIPAVNTDIIKLNYVFNAGTKYGNAAVIKLLSRVIFEGSEDFPGDSLSEKVDGLGAYIFSKADKDKLVFSLVCQKQNLYELAQIFQNSVFHPELNADRINVAAKREENSLIEAFQYNATIAEDIFLPAILGENNPYSKVLHPEDFQNISHTELRDFHHKYINADNGYVLISGELNDSEKINLLSLFETQKGSGFNAIPPILEDFNYQPLIKNIQNPYSSQTYILLGFQSIIKSHPDYIGLKIVSTLLGGYIGSRLMQNIREKSGYTYDIYSSIVSNEQVGVFRIASEIIKGTDEKVLAEVEKEINRLKNEPVGEDELVRLKNYLSGELLGAFDGMFSCDSSFQSVYNFGLGLDYYQKFLDTVKKLNPSYIRSMANEYINFDNFTKVIVQPK